MRAPMAHAPAAHAPMSARRPIGPPVGTAVPRSGSGRPIPYYGSHYGLPYYGAFGGALGLGLYAYDDPYWYGADDYPYGPYGAIDPYVPPVGDDTGGLRLDVKPKSADVFVDGHAAGAVDDFSGHFEHLDLAPGPHHIELRAPGYQPVQFDVNIMADHTIQYHGTLARS